MKWKTTAPAGIPNGSQQPSKKCEEAAVKIPRHNQARHLGTALSHGEGWQPPETDCPAAPSLE